MLIRLLAVGLALFGARRVIIRYRKGQSLVFEFLVWMVIFAGLAIVVFIPHETDRFARLVGVSTGFNALVFLVIVGLLLAVQRLFVRTQQLERELTQLVRTLALGETKSASARAPDSSEPRG